MVAVCLHRRAVRVVGGDRISSCGVGRGAPLGSHVAAPAAVGGRRASDPPRCAGVAAAARHTAPLHVAWWTCPAAPIASCACTGPSVRAAGDLLECRDGHLHRLAYPTAFSIGAALGNVACRRTRELSWKRPDVLVARRPALAEYRELASLVDPAVPVRRDVTLRRVVRLSRVLGSRGLSDVPIRAASLWLVCAPGPGICRRIHVALLHYRVRDSGDGRDDHAPLSSDRGSFTAARFPGLGSAAGLEVTPASRCAETQCDDHACDEDTRSHSCSVATSVNRSRNSSRQARGHPDSSTFGTFRGSTLGGSQITGVVCEHRGSMKSTSSFEPIEGEARRWIC